MPVSITPAAQQKIGEFIESQGLNQTTTYLRLAVHGGGCSGLQYALQFDEEVSDKDKIFEEKEWGFRVVIDKKSYIYLNGSTVDYEQVGIQAGFTVKNPNAKSSCGCGHSFHT